LNPVRGYRESLERKGVRPKNHHEANLASLRTQAEVIKQTKQKEVEEREQKHKFKLARFRNVPSKVSQYMGSGDATREPYDENEKGNANYLRRSSGTNGVSSIRRTPIVSDHERHALDSSPSIDADAVKNEKRQKIKPPVPKATDCHYVPPAALADNKDYVRENRAGLDGAPASVSVTTAAKQAGPLNYKLREEYGKVPQYLLDRKIEMAQEAEKQRLAAAEAQQPTGMVKMSEEERLATLAVLNENSERILSDLAHLPLRVETLSAQQRKTALEAKLRDIEDAVRVFSRKTVYVRA